MIAAIAQLLIIDIGPLVLLPGLLLDTGYFLALLLGGLDLLLDDRDYLLMDAQIVVQIPGNEVVNKGRSGPCQLPCCRSHPSPACPTCR